MRKLLVGIAVGILLVITSTQVFAGDCDSACNSVEGCEQKITECQRIWADVEAAKKPHEDSLAAMERDIANFQARIGKLTTDINDKAAAIAEEEKNLGELQTIVEGRIRQFYIRSYSNNPIAIFLSAGSNISEALQALSYQNAITNQDKKVIADTVYKIVSLEDRKAQLESEQGQLSKLTADLNTRAGQTKSLISEAASYQNTLSASIATLTSKQQSILAARLGSLNLPSSLGAGPLYCTDDRKLDPGFSGGFAFFTFGIPHRVGMNQYGAYGRAQAGQGYQDILRAYFNDISFEGGKEGITIKVQGHGEMSLDEYVLGIYEVSESWPLEAQKAQAVAARSYALSYTDNGQKEICTTQACQVWKPEKKTGQWKQAVEETKGQVMTNGGNVITAWYASTAGGYTFTSGDVWGSDKAWTKRMRDTNGDAGSFADLQAKAYDRDSPCFYAAQGWRSEYNKSAWLKSEEVADIVNALMLAKQDSSLGDHLYQTDKPHPYGGEVWDANRVKSELKQRGITPYDSVSGIDVSADFGSGQTTTVNVQGNAGTKSFSGGEFKDHFNLRAPANIQIVGPLYNVERK